MLGNICKVVREILGHVERLAERADDVVQMGERVLDTLQLLNKMKGNMAKFGTTDDLKRRWSDLHVVLRAISDALARFGKRGGMAHLFALRRHGGKLSELDARLGRGLESLLHFYQMERDARLLEPRAYSLEAAVELRVQEEMRRGATEEAALAALQRNEAALRDIAAEVGVDSEELLSEMHEFRGEVHEFRGEVHEFRGEVNEKLDEALRKMSEVRVDDGEKTYQYEPHDDDDDDQ